MWGRVSEQGGVVEVGKVRGGGLRWMDRVKVEGICFRCEDLNER